MINIHDINQLEKEIRIVAKLYNIVIDEDAIQDAHLAILEKKNKIKTRTYLQQIIRNSIMKSINTNKLIPNRRNKKHYNNNNITYVDIDEYTNMTETDTQDEHNNNLNEYLKDINANDIDIYIYIERYAYNRTCDDIAEELKLNSKTVHNKLISISNKLNRQPYNII